MRALHADHAGQGAMTALALVSLDGRTPDFRVDFDGKIVRIVMLGLIDVASN